MKKNPSSNLYQAVTNESGSKALRKVHQSLIIEEGKETEAHTYPSFAEQYQLAPLLPIIGREREIAAICTLLRESEVRLLTMAGPGGVGKTRLALQLATEVSSFFPDGICSVSLIHINDVDLLLPAIAHTLGLTERENYSPLALLQEAISDKRFLLILDNFEHIASAAPQLKELLACCPQLKILVTSRIVLSLLEEHELYINPLELPDLTAHFSCKDLAQVPAVSLFLQRVRTVCPDFKLTNANARLIAQICVCLDGLPLAIELAAARMKLFSPQGLLTRLDKRLSLLTSGPRDAPERQQTLRKTIEWSYDLLTQEEQRLFRRLAIFVGGCSLQAIEVISDDMTSEQEEPLLNVVTSLLNQSLLQRTPQVSNQEERFMMLDTIREYALECLQSNKEEEIIRRMHAECYLALTRTLEEKVMRDKAAHWIPWIESEFENLQQALGWFLSSRDAEHALEMSGALWPFWLESATLEGCNWITMALEGCQNSATKVQVETKAMAIHTIAMLKYYRGTWEQADKLASKSLQLFRSINNIPGMSRVMVTQGIGALLQSHYAVAGKLTYEGLRLWPKVPSNWLTAEALLVQAYSYYFQGDLLHAYTVGKKAFKLSRQIGEFYIVIRAVYAYALFAHAQKNADEVQAMYEVIVDVTGVTIETSSLSPVAVCLVCLGAIVALQKQYTWAVSLWGKAKVLYRRRDGLSELEPHKWLTIILRTHLLSSQIVEIVYAQLGELAFNNAWNEGQAMPLEQLLEKPKPTQNMTPSSQKKRAAAYSDKLTKRQREVLALLTQGMTSASIAEKLVISPVTVNTHIRTIYSKLGVSSRSAATRFAIEHHLI